jgi:serine protease Do
MKKRIYQAISAGIFLLALAQGAIGQPPPPPPAAPPVAPNAPQTIVIDRNDQKEIIIRQKNDKDTKITLEIKNGDFFINGKPLEKFDDDNVIVEKRDIDEEEPVMAYLQSPFRDNRWNEENAERLDMLRSQEDMARNQADVQRNIQKSMKIRMNSAFLGVSSKKTDKGGATVLEVTKGSPAEKAGIKKGDIITKVNDTKIENPDVLFETIHNYKVGDKVKILLTRDGKEQTVTATLEKSQFEPNDYDFNYKYNYKMPPMDLQMPPMPDMGDMQFRSWNNGKPKLGIKAQDAEDGKGVNVLEVNDSSAAAKTGIKKGDIILQIDGTDVNSVNQLLELTMSADRQKSTFKLKILRNGATQEMVVKIPRKLKTAEL